MKKLEPEIKQDLLIKFANRKNEITNEINSKEKNVKKLKEDIKNLNERLDSHKKSIKKNQEK